MRAKSRELLAFRSSGAYLNLFRKIKKQNNQAVTDPPFLTA